jgi:hypothetical protein
MPATSPWYQGAAVPLAWTSTDTSGVPFEATSPTLVVTAPDASTSSPAITHVGSGVYTASFVTTLAGHHLVAWTATASGKADAFCDSFEVQSSADPTIVSLLEAKEILQLQGTTADDLLLQGYNAAATEVADYICGPSVTRQVTEVVRAQGTVLTLSFSPVRTDLGTTLDPSNRRDGSTTNGIVSITPLLSYGFMYDLSQLLTDPDTGLVRHSAGLPFFYSGDPYAQFKVTYYAGRKVIPSGIYQGCKIILEHLFMVKRGGVGAQDVASGESVTVVPGFSFAIPNRALELFNTASGAASRAAFA